MSAGPVRCYNKGCTQEFYPENNSDDACQFHPGAPVFHDAYKGWSCCSKKSVDFTEFLNIPGCTRGPHSNEKPPEQEAPKKDPSLENEVIQVSAPCPVQRKESKPRPSSDEPMVPISPAVSKSAMDALEKKLKELGMKPEGTENDTDLTTLKVGTTCKNGGCPATYKGDQCDKGTCIYHPGGPIFHEGYKFWSCCKKRTTDFEEFQKQVGCASGSHLWVKKIDESKKNIQSCRYDWYQTGNFVTISFYAKAAIPESSSLAINRVSAKVHINFDAGQSVFEKTFLLGGVINPEKSTFKILGSKVEVNLYKGEPNSWSSLELTENGPN